MIPKQKSWKRLIAEIKEAKQDPEFVEGVKEFINYTSGRRIYKV